MPPRRILKPSARDPLVAECRDLHDRLKVLLDNPKFVERLMAPEDRDVIQAAYRALYNVRLMSQLHHQS